MNICEAAKAISGTKLTLWRESDPERWYKDINGELTREGRMIFGCLCLSSIDSLAHNDWRVTTDKERKAFIKAVKERKFR